MSSKAQLSARDRILSLLDDNSFVEIGAMVTKRSTDFNLQKLEAPADGVITGYGIINGNPVYVYSQDVKAMGGSIGEMHAKKIAGLYDISLKGGVQVIGLIDTAGLRLQEAADALAGVGEIFLKQTMASGVIPQITAVFGNCGGGSAVSAALSDFVYMTKDNASLFVNAPNAIEGNNIGKCNTASAAFKAGSGSVDFVLESEEEVLASIRELIDILPSNNESELPEESCNDDLNRLTDGFEDIIGDPAVALAAISDDSFFMEVKKEYAKDMVTGFIKLNGATIGAVANRTVLLDETGKAVEKFEACLSQAGCYKAEAFVEFCDAFGIPVLTLTNVNGYKASACEEKGVAIAAAKLTYAFANATVPKVNLITGKAFGSAYITMNSKHIGADFVYCLPNAQIGTMEAKLAAQIIYADDIKTAKDSTAMLNEKANEYDSLVQSAATAARRGYVDTIIEGASVRKQMIYAFEMLYSKREDRPAKKHGTV